MTHDPREALERICQRANETGGADTMALIDTIHAMHGIAREALTASAPNGAADTTIPDSSDMDARFRWLEAKAIDMGYVLVQHPASDAGNASAEARLREALTDEQCAVVCRYIGLSEDAPNFNAMRDGLRAALSAGGDEAKKSEVEIPEPVYKAVERILDEKSAWIARPNDEVTKSVALQAVVAAHKIIAESCSICGGSGPSGPSADRPEIVAIKPLVWSQKPPPGHEHEPFVYWAAGIGGHYRAERGGMLWMAHDAFVWEEHPTQKAAKEAAQADYEKAILAALGGR